MWPTSDQTVNGPGLTCMHRRRLDVTESLQKSVWMLHMSVCLFQFETYCAINVWQFDHLPSIREGQLSSFCPPKHRRLRHSDTSSTVAMSTLTVLFFPLTHSFKAVCSIFCQSHLHEVIVWIGAVHTVINKSVTFTCSVKVFCILCLLPYHGDQVMNSSAPPKFSASFLATFKETVLGKLTLYFHRWTKRCQRTIVK